MGRPPKWAPVAVSSSSPHRGARQGLIRLRLTMRGARSVRSQHLVVLGACWLYVSLLSFFPAFLSPLSFSQLSPQHPWDPWSPLVPTCLLCSGNKGRGTAFCETPLRFSHHFASQPTWPWLAEPVPPSPSLPGDGRNLGEPRAPPEPANLILWLSVAPCLGAVPFAPRRPHAMGDATSKSRAPGSLLRSRATGLPRGHCPAHSGPSPRQKGRDSELNN